MKKINLDERQPDSFYRRNLMLVVERLKQPDAEKHFEWVGKDWAGSPDLSCGTTACAVGFATTIPELRKLGFRLLRRSCYCGIPVLTRGGDEQSLDWAAKLFGLCNVEEYYLFYPDYPNPYAEAHPSSYRALPAASPAFDATAAEVRKHIERFTKVRYPLSKKKASK